ncbi:MAG: phage holin family protein [Parachlamydiales bacterium]|nr:phage holin family protein [Parachlamydiales bacterium]
MTYLRSLFFNFFAVFFVLRVMPGIRIDFFENVPNIGADIFFSFIVGLLNSLIVPFLFFIDSKITNFKIFVFTFCISFLSFIMISIFDIGVQASVLGVFLGGIFICVFGFFTNYLELKHFQK